MVDIVRVPGGVAAFEGALAACLLTEKRIINICTDANDEGLQVSFEDGTSIRIRSDKTEYSMGLFSADPTGGVHATGIIQSIIDGAQLGVRIVARGTFRTTLMIVGRDGITFEIPKGSQISVDHTGYAFHVVPGFSIVGGGFIKHLQPTALGSLWMAPTATYAYGVSRRPVIGDLVIQSVSDTAPTGAALHWDMTLQNGSFADVGNVTCRGWDVAEKITVPPGRYITSVLHKQMTTIFCRAHIDFAGGGMGQVAGWTYDAIHIQPYGPPDDSTQEFGVKLDNAQFFQIDNLLCWDWDTKTDPLLIKQKVYLGSNTSDMSIGSPTTRNYQCLDLGIRNRVVTGGGATITSAILQDSHPQGGPDYPLFHGRQDDILANADKMYSAGLTVVGNVGGYQPAWMFDQRPQQFCRFVGDGTLKSVEIDLGAACKLHAVGIVCPSAAAPSRVVISVYNGGAYYAVYDSSHGGALHISGTGIYRTAISRIKVEFSKAANFDVTEIFAYAGDLTGQAFLQTNGATTMIDDISFHASAAGKGLSMIDLTTGLRKRVYLDAGALVIV